MTEVGTIAGTVSAVASRTTSTQSTKKVDTSFAETLTSATTAAVSTTMPAATTTTTAPVSAASDSVSVSDAAAAQSSSAAATSSTTDTTTTSTATTTTVSASSTSSSSSNDSPLIPGTMLDPLAGIVTQYYDPSGDIVSQVPSTLVLTYLRAGLTADGLSRQHEVGSGSSSIVA